MQFLKKLSKRLLALTLLAITVGQALMPAEIAYARANDPARFVLTLKEAFDQDIDQRQANLVFRTLSLFPERFYKSLNNVTLYFQKNNRSPRGRANSQKIVLEAGKMSDPEMLAVLIHELGHVYDLGTAQGTRRAASSAFKFKNGEAVKSDDPSLKFYTLAWSSSTRYRGGIDRVNDFISTYGASSPFEDFGEAFVFYVLHGEEFVKRARSNEILKAKYKYLWEAFSGQRFAFGSNQAYPKTFFDATKLSYDFAKMLSYADQQRRTLAREENLRKRRQTRKRDQLRRLAQSRLRPLAIAP
ncbi:MAG TPA: hypothetical protein VIT68_03995 [Candidatus Gracilibacteria bacterium]